MQHPGHFTVIEAGRHRDIRRLAPRLIAKRSSEGPAPAFMHGKREDMRVIMKGILHAVTVMGVNIHIKQR